MLSPSAESSSSIGSPTVSEVLNANDRLRRSSSPSSDEEEAETPVEPQIRQQKRQNLEGSVADGGASSGKMPTSARRRRSACGIYIGDSGVWQIMEPALRQLDATCAELGAPFSRELAANFETCAVLKSTDIVSERLRSVLSVRVDLCQRLFLSCLAGLAGLLGLDAGPPDPDPALADAFAAVRRSAERFADRLRCGLQRAALPRAPDEPPDEPAWSRAALDARPLAEGFGQAADRAAWRRLRTRRLRRSGVPGEPALFAQLTLRKALLTSAAGAVPKFHHEEAVRHLLMAMAARVAAEVEAAALTGASAAAAGAAAEES